MALYIDNGDRACAIAALRQGLDLGMAHIDTAKMYGSAEEVVAEAIAQANIFWSGTLRE